MCDSADYQNKPKKTEKQLAIRQLRRRIQIERTHKKSQKK